MADEVRPATILNAGTLLIFGASGDLTARKLMPALFMLWREKLLSDTVSIFGVARREKTDESFRDEMRDAVTTHGRGGEIPADEWDAFARRLFY